MLSLAVEQNHAESLQGRQKRKQLAPARPLKLHIFIYFHLFILGLTLLEGEKKA